MATRAMKIRATPELIALLRGIRLGTVPGGGERWKAGDIVAVEPEARIEAYAHIFDGFVLPRAIGAFSYTHSPCDPWISIGRYCSIAAGVAVMGADHPLEWASSSSFSYHPYEMGGMLAYMQDYRAKPFRLHPRGERPLKVEIGHDVWIGGRVMFKRGISIGTGAAIAAGSVVTRDVPPYAIVGGVPARIIRHRFGEELIERLLRSQWWRFGPDLLQPLDVREPEAFVGRREAAIAGGLAPLELKSIGGEAIIAAGETI